MGGAGERVRQGDERWHPRLTDVPESLARIHVDFERLHPFIDGNGRTGRLLLNLILTRLGWPPIVIFKEQRRRYLDGLDRADNGDLGPLAELIARSVVDNLHRLIPNIAGPAKYVPLEALADKEFSLAALKQAAGRVGSKRSSAQTGATDPVGPLWRPTRHRSTLEAARPDRINPEPPL